MEWFSRVLWLLFKYGMVSLFFAAVTFIGTVSVLHQSFPPTWKQIKNVEKNLGAIGALRQKKFLATKDSQRSLIEFSSDSSLEEVDEILNYRKNQAALSEALVGETTFASSPPADAESELEARLHKLELLVSSLQEQVRQLQKPAAQSKRSY